MKHPQSQTQKILAAVAMAALLCVPAKAANQTWNNSASDFIWDTASTNWNGAAWTNGNTAIFGATGPGAITVGSGITAAGNTQINANGYTFAGSTLTLGNLSLASGINSEFANNIVTGASQTFTVNGGTLTFKGGGSFGTSASAPTFNGSATTGGTYEFAQGSYTFLTAPTATNCAFSFTGESTFSSLVTGVQFAINYGSGTSAFNYSSSGSSSIASFVTLGRSAGKATWTQSAGTISLPNNSAFAFQVGNNAGATALLDLKGSAELRVNGGANSTVVINNNNAGFGTVLVQENANLTTTNVALNSGAGGSSSLTLKDNGTVNVDKITVANGGTKTVSLLSGTMGTNTSTAGAWAANMSLDGNVNFRAATASGSSAGITMSGTLSGTGGFTKIGTGTLTLQKANSYTGNTIVNAGVLKAGIASGATSGAFGYNSAVTLADESGAGLDITGFNTEIGSLTGGGANGGNVTLGAATLTLGGDGTSPAAYAGSIAGTGGLTKIGEGTQTLSGANTYSGTTTINGGALIVSGSLTGSTNISVSVPARLQLNQAALLATTGTVNVMGTLALNGASTAGQLNFAPGSTFATTISGTSAGSHGNISANGGVILDTTGAGVTLAITTGYTPSFVEGDLTQSDKFLLTLGNGVAPTGTFANVISVTDASYGGLTLNEFTDASGHTWAVFYAVDFASGYDATNGWAPGNDIALMAIPEPATWSMMVGGFGMLVLAQRMRRRKAH